jgi:hypothetical protein
MLEVYSRLGVLAEQPGIRRNRVEVEMIAVDVCPALRGVGTSPV